MRSAGLGSALVLFLILFGVLHPAAGTHAAEAPSPAIGLIIDDLGNRPDLDLRVVNLPGAVTCAFLPHTPHARRLANVADALGKEVMLHLPMQALDASNTDPGMLRLGMSRRDFVESVRDGLAALPHVRGVNNHMGSLLTQSSLRMQWLMDELKRHDDLYFVDSYTSERSVAHRVATRNLLPSVRRDVFLDASRDPEFIRAQFELLMERARENGTAVGIAHPYPETVEFLESRLGGLHAEGVELLSISGLILRREALDAEQPVIVTAGPAGEPDSDPATVPAGGVLASHRQLELR